ncbi:MAG: hypothetical protein HQL47_03375 [Gammaproteobacteria bacterium]|nr:hypothetical protein [Gammaproteobacteria bacterium]
MCGTSNDNDLPIADRTLAAPEALTRLCEQFQPEQGIEVLVEAIGRLMPDLCFTPVLHRGGWHRLGGVVAADMTRVTGNILHWVEQCCDGDVDELIAEYADAGYFATRLSGTTHYLTAQRGTEPQDFVQIEIEVLQEVLDRPLVIPDWYPDSIEEFLEPIGYPSAEPRPVAPPSYQFRRITSIADLIGRRGAGRQIENLSRFFSDWAASTASDAHRFCDHWVLALREYQDREGLSQLVAKPVATFQDEALPLPQGEIVRGTDLANAIHGYDRQLGYPFAWYFMMLGQKSKHYGLADAVLADQMGAYEYLPARDLKVLRHWEKQPYGL